MALGTLRAIDALLSQYGWCERYRPGRPAPARGALAGVQNHGEIDLDGLAEQRRNVILPGVAIISALFDVLGIEHYAHLPAAPCARA